MGEHAALQIGAQLTLDLGGQGMVAGADLLQERLQMVGHHLIEQVLLGLVASIGGSGRGPGWHAAA